MSAMAKRNRPQNHRYREFDSIEGEVVHLRLIDEDEDVPPTFTNMKVQGALTGKPGERSGTFVDQETGRVFPDISEKVYVAWTRY